MPVFAGSEQQPSRSIRPIRIAIVAFHSRTSYLTAFANPSLQVNPQHLLLATAVINRVWIPSSPATDSIPPY